MAKVAELSFKDLSFREEKESVKVLFLKIFSTEISKTEMQKIGKFKVKEHSIVFDGTEENAASSKFNFLLGKAFNELKSGITGKKTVYVHQNSGIPLIGNNGFGIVDRNTNLIEIKPITGCNIKCVYCSVDLDKRTADFVVEEEYLVSELRKLIEIKARDDIEVHIGTQGEPLLYSPLTELIRDIKQIKGVKAISMDTNGTMITNSKADELISAGLTQFNLSINALDEKLSSQIAGCPYQINKVVALAEHIAKSGNPSDLLILTPVYVPGLNDDEIPKIISLAKKLKCRIGIQNFLNYRFGKNPVKNISWEKFYDKMKGWEKDLGVKLILGPEDFSIVKAKKLEKPFRKEEVVRAVIACPGRMKGEMVAVAKGRTITVANCYEAVNLNKEIKVKITRDKHNIFYGTKIK